MLGFGILLSTSSINGEEFSPITFQKRSFSYSRLPWTKIRIAKTALGPPIATAPTDVLKHLPTLGQSVVWHVATLRTWNDETHPASILVDSLEQRNADGANAWGAWSFDHPQSAAILWPMVQQVALQSLYSCIPEMLRAAESSTSPEQLELRSFEVIADAVQGRVADWSLTGQTEESESLLAWWESRTPIHAGENGEAIESLRRRVRRSLTTKP